MVSRWPLRLRIMSPAIGLAMTTGPAPLAIHPTQPKIDGNGIAVCNDSHPAASLAPGLHGFVRDARVGWPDEIRCRNHGSGSGMAVPLRVAP